MTAGASQRNPREEGTYKSYRTVIKSTKLFKAFYIHGTGNARWDNISTREPAREALMHQRASQTHVGQQCTRVEISTCNTARKAYWRGLLRDTYFIFYLFLFFFYVLPCRTFWLHKNLIRVVDIPPDGPLHAICSFHNCPIYVAHYTRLTYSSARWSQRWF